MSGRRIPVVVREQAVAQVLSGDPPAEVARQFSVSVSSLRRWVGRARSGAPVVDLPRPGRPRIQDTADQVVAAVLGTAGNRVDGPDYSSREIARATGLSQSVVSRAMRRFMPSPGTPEEDAADAVSMRVVALAVNYPYIVVGLETGGVVRPDSRRRRAKRAASLRAGLRAAGVPAWDARVGQERRTDNTARMREFLESHPASLLLVLDPVGTLDTREDAPVREGERPEGDRIRFFAGFEEFDTALGAALGRADSLPGTLLELVAARVPRGLEGVTWAAHAGRGNAANSIFFDSSGMLPDSQWLLQDNPSLTEQISVAIRLEIMESGFRPGDRISLTHLRRRMGLPRSTVDAGIRRMVDDGLLDASAGGVAIPAVTVADVIDVYAARRALGEVLLRGLALREKRDLVPVRQALKRVQAVASTADPVDDADLRFQQELARASGITQTARAFESLTVRLRMYISVLLLDYRPAAGRIVRDDTTIMRCLESGDLEGALRAWRAKLDNAVRHMSGIARHSRFDVDLWSRLTGESGVRPDRPGR